MASVPSKARAVIIGGGVAGCSVAYHLAKLGWTRHRAARAQAADQSGTTWHAAGLIGQLRATANMTQLAKYSQELYGALEAETGVATGFKRIGSISLALTDGALRGTAAAAPRWRAPTASSRDDLAGRGGARAIRCSTSTARSAPSISPRTGRATPPTSRWPWPRARAIAASSIFENVKVTGITQAERPRHRRRHRRRARSRPRSSSTARACGAREVGRHGRRAAAAAGLRALLHRHRGRARTCRAICRCCACPTSAPTTRRTPARSCSAPSSRSPSRGRVDGIPEDFCFDQLPEDFDHFAPILETGDRRACRCSAGSASTRSSTAPRASRTTTAICSARRRSWRNFYVACGFNSVGIQSAGGAGMALAQWIVDGAPPFDLWDVDVRRVFPLPGDEDRSSRRASPRRSACSMPTISPIASTRPRAACATRRSTSS